MAETAENVKNVSSDEEWETVAQESGKPLAFDIGIPWVGTFLGIHHIIPPSATKEEDEFDQAHFEDADGTTRTVNLGYKLYDALKDVEVGKRVRITRMEDVPSNDPKKNDMKDYRVEVAR